jgi:hypothetical protein
MPVAILRVDKAVHNCTEGTRKKKGWELSAPKNRESNRSKKQEKTEWYLPKRKKTTGATTCAYQRVQNQVQAQTQEEKHKGK